MWVEICWESLYVDRQEVHGMAGLFSRMSTSVAHGMAQILSHTVPGGANTGDYPGDSLMDIVHVN